jgi:protein ImuB
LGLVDEPISPRPPPPAHRAQLSFAEPIGQAEALPAVTRRLLAELCGALAAASLGARRLTLAFYRVDNSTAAIGVGTSRPCRDARQLERLLAEKLERVDPGFGIERAILEAAVVEPLLPEPLAWRAMGAGDLDQARDLAPLVDRLTNRLGRDAVSQLVPHASHIPERAQARVPALSPEAGLPFPARGRHGPAPARPLRLLARPEPIETVAPLPDEPPVLFRWRRALHKVRAVRGPERLAPEWWRAPDADPAATTRDYFAVEDTEGGRFWLFREGLYLAGAAMPRWYLHGLFG